MKITDSAKQAIEGILHQHDANGIRIYFAGMGWGGPKMGMALDEPQEKDLVEELNGIRVAIDERIVTVTKDLTVDFQQTEQGAGLVFLGQEDCC